MIHEQNFSLLPYNTFGISVACRDFYEYASSFDLELLYKNEIFESKWMSIGGGSNLLFLNDYDGSVLHSAIKTIDVLSESDYNVVVKVGAGIVWDDFVEWSVEHHLGGVENLSLVPGSVGASPVQNIGAYGVEAKDTIISVHAFDVTTGKFVDFSADECEFGYRYSRFKREKKYVVDYVTFSLQKESAYSYKLEYGGIKQALKDVSSINLRQIRNSIVEIRKNKLPDTAVLGCAGSFFKNPIVGNDVFESLAKIYPEMPYFTIDEKNVKIPAGWLIEKAGWKGKSLNNAGVYDKQALVLVNKGGATGKDVWHLAEVICNDVKSQFGIKIEPEVCVIS